MKNQAILGLVSIAATLTCVIAKPSQAATLYYSDREKVIFTSDYSDLAIEFDIQSLDYFGDITETAEQIQFGYVILSIDADTDFVFESTGSHSFIKIEGFPCGIHDTPEDHKFAVLVGSKQIGGNKTYGIDEPLDFMTEVGYPVKNFKLFFPQQQTTLPISLEFTTTGGTFSIYSKSHLPPRDPITPPDETIPPDETPPIDDSNPNENTASVPEPSFLSGFLLLGGASLLRKKIRSR